MFFIENTDTEIRNWRMVERLDTLEDVATLLDIYDKCLHKYKPEQILYVAERDGYYACVVSQSLKGTFDLFKFISEVYSQSEGVRVTCANAKLLFPIDLSRGEYEESGEEKEEGTGLFEDSEEIPTGFLDEESCHYLLHVATGTEIPIDSVNGVLIGRSKTKVGYSVDNNMMSRMHARFYLMEDKYYVEDLGSRNGTFVNNLRVSPNKSAEVIVGSSIRLANEEFRLV